MQFLKEYVAALEGAFLKDDIEKIVLDYMKTMPLEKLQEKKSGISWALLQRSLFSAV